MFNLFPRTPHAGGRKARPMSERTDAPPSTDVNQQIAALASAVQQLADSQKSLVQRLQAGPQAGAALGAADVQRIVADSLAQQQQATRVSGARDRYLAEKMSDLPSLYQQQMPVSDDPALLASQEQRIRERYRGDFKAAHPNARADVNAGALPGSKPADVLDLSRLSPTQLIAKGLERAKPSNAGTRTQPAEGPAAQTA